MVLDYIKYIEKAFKNNDIQKFDNSSNVEKLLYLYSYYHYHNADDSKIIDILDSQLDNETIDSVVLDEESDENQIDLNHIYYVEDNKVNPKVVINTFIKMKEEFSNAWNEAGDQQLFTKMKDAGYNSSKQIHLRIITNGDATAKVQAEIDDAISEENKLNNRVKLVFVSGSELEFEILDIEDPKQSVDSGYIEIDKANNYLTYGDEDSIVVNVSAKSIKKNYEEHGFRGLFSMNLRYYVKKKDIDDNIIDSIKKNPQDFWYLNNGIIILCDDFKVSGKKIELKEYSIVNGGQTSKLIGTNEFDNDFFLTCKIIKVAKRSKESKAKFTYKVAEASNSQKPIKNKDLVSNKPEQKLLKEQLSKANIFIQIKRGEKVNKRVYKEAWQNTTNEEYAQFVNSFMYQKPGKSRSSKASLTTPKYYPVIFGKTYASELIKDLMKIKVFYKTWVTLVSETEYEDEDKIGLTKNATLFNFAMIGLLAKIYYNKELVRTVVEKSWDSKQKLDFMISQQSFDHQIFDMEDKDLEPALHELFEFTYENYLSEGYDRIRDYKPELDYSNFTKTDSNYLTFVAKTIIRDFDGNINTKLQKLLDNLFYKPTIGEKKADDKLFDQIEPNYEAWLIRPKDSDVSIDDVDLIDELKDYRKKIWYNSRKRVKPYDVFTDKQMKEIIEIRPTSVDELGDIKKFTQEQVEKYGEDIIAIISKFK